MPDVTLVVPCKGRLHHLKRTLPSLLGQQGVAIHQVLVVDYGCPDRTSKYCLDRLALEQRLNCIETSDGHGFNLNRARNIGARTSSADLVAFLDADIIPSVDFLHDGVTAFMESRKLEMVSYCVALNTATGNGDFFLHKPWDGSANPVCVARMMTRELWLQMEGFDEGFQDWGYDDCDFRYRALREGVRERIVPARFCFLNHAEDESVKFYDEKDKQVSAERNLKRMHDVSRPINPDGFGQTSFLPLRTA